MLDESALIQRPPRTAACRPEVGSLARSAAWMPREYRESDRGRFAEGGRRSKANRSRDKARFDPASDPAILFTDSQRARALGRIPASRMRADAGRVVASAGSAWMSQKEA